METKRVTILAPNQQVYDEWLYRCRENKWEYELTKVAKVPGLILDEGTAKELKAEQYILKASKAMRRFIRVLLTLLAVAVIAIIVGECSKEPEVLTAEEQMKKDLDDKYGLSSQWLAEYCTWVSTGLLDPGSYRTEDVLILPIDRDSFTLVLDYSGKNAFNARIRNSITSVINSNTGELQRIVSRSNN